MVVVNKTLYAYSCQSVATCMQTAEVSSYLHENSRSQDQLQDRAMYNVYEITFYHFLRNRLLDDSFFTMLMYTNVMCNLSFFLI